LLFVRNDKQWISFATSAGSLGCLFVGYIAMNATFEPTIDQKGWLLTSYLLGFLVSTLIFFYVFSKILKTQSETIQLRILDILLGRSSTLEEYYNDRRQEILHDLNSEEIIRQKNQLDLDIQRKEDILEKINSTENKNVAFEIKVNCRYPITKEFIQDIPQFIEKWSKFVSEVSGLTKDFTDKKQKMEKLNRSALDGYFIALCGAINSILFRNSPQAVRSHVRILNKENSVYRKVVSVEGTDTANKRVLTDIPVDKGMIFHAFQEKSSLIMSYNTEFHFGKTKSQWYDYLTIPLYGIEIQIDNQYRPFISLGIAIQSGYHHEDMLIFLHFMKIERFIQDEIKSLNCAEEIYSAYHGDGGKM